jgi:hypothetical protein
MVGPGRIRTCDNTVMSGIFRCTAVSCHDAKIVDKVDGQWVEIDARSERLIRREHGEKLDAERRRKHDVILQLIYD